MPEEFPVTIELGPADYGPPGAGGGSAVPGLDGASPEVEVPAAPGFVDEEPPAPEPADPGAADAGTANAGAADAGADAEPCSEPASDP